MPKVEVSLYDRLYQENRGLLWYWVNRYSGACCDRPTADVEDLVQEGFFALIEASASYQCERGAWSTWASLYIRKAMREALGLRGKKQLPTVSLDAPIGDEADADSLGSLLPDESLPSSDESILRRELILAVREAVNSIESENVRNAVRWIYLEGKSPAEAAQTLGIDRTAIPGLLNRGKLAIRRNHHLRKAHPDLDEMTRFHAHKGVEAFIRDRTSTVEAAVLWREEQRERTSKRIE